MVWMLKKHDTAIIKEIEQQRDRAAAVIAAACLEDRLAELLLTALEPHEDITNQMFKGYGPLASFRAKIDLALLLGIYGEHEHKLLIRIKDIRNLFAHTSDPITFKSRQITDLCDNFQPLRKRPKNLSLGKREITREVLDELIQKHPHDAITAFEITARFGKDTARNRYFFAVKSMMFFFSLILQIARGRRELSAVKEETRLAKAKMGIKEPYQPDYWPWPSSHGKSSEQRVQPPQIARRKRKRPPRPPSASLA